MASKKNAKMQGTQGKAKKGHAVTMQKGQTKAFQQHDAARRLGSFEGAGNHARTGNRGHQ